MQDMKMIDSLNKFAYKRNRPEKDQEMTLQKKNNEYKTQNKKYKIL